MTIDFRLTASYRENPLGMTAAGGIMLGWSAFGEGVIDAERGVDIEVAESEADLEAGRLLWRADGLRDVVARYGGRSPSSRERLHWRVTGRDTLGATVTGTAAFEIGLEHPHDWTCPWMAAPIVPMRRETWDPVALLRAEVVLDVQPVRARIYATALGAYRLWVNGVEATSASLLRPGWTDFGVRVLHQTYDVGTLLRPGVNAVAVELANGWYAGWLGLQREPGYYGDRPAFRVQLESGGVSLLDGRERWRHATGEIVASDLLRGEAQDMRQAMPGWREPGFDDREWAHVEVLEDLDVPIVPQPHDPPAPAIELEGRLVRAHARGPAVFDFGQNVVGWTRIRTRTHPAADLIVRHGERLTVDELVWRDNLRGAFQEDRYTTGTEGPHVLEPRHTLHGFQFAEVWGLVPATRYAGLEVPDDVAITAVAVGGGQRRVGMFECSDAALTRVAGMVEWTIRDNAIEVFTDCPQRDERLGWLGDAGVIADTAAYHFDIAAFLRKFARDAADSQDADGMIHDYAPTLLPARTRDGAPGWADGYVRLVHLAARRYGDLVTASEHVDAIGRYLAAVDAANPDGIRSERVGADFSDWLSLPDGGDEPTHPGYEYTGAHSTSSRRVVATAHSIRSFDQYADVLRWLGRPEEAASAAARAAQIRAAYVRTFVDDRGWIEGDTQTVYAQAIGWRLVEGAMRDLVGDRLAEKVETVGHVTTGIHGVQHILPALVDIGRADLAARLLMRGEMPSWRFMALAGATTVWEKWDALRPDGTHSTAEMNSLNHCALGAVGEFLFERVAGIDARDTARDRRIVAAPVFIDGVEWVRAEHETVAGPVRAAWRRDRGRVSHTLELGPAVAARIEVPAGWCLEGAVDTPSVDLGPGRHDLSFVRR